ncbi:MAG: hypothetical protein HC905_20840 [Bacteroidales bacterium]|nr:hypothetical protein [Bacteroidales bacterium]
MGAALFKEGCNFKIGFEQFGKKLTDKQVLTLIEKKKSPKIKGFTHDNKKVNGSIVLLANFSLDLQIEQEKEPEQEKTVRENQVLLCPVCSKGSLLKGKQAWGCSRFKEGCRFLIPFDELSQKYNTTELTGNMLATYNNRS